MPRAQHSTALSFPRRRHRWWSPPAVVSTLRTFGRKQPLGMIGASLLSSSSTGRDAPLLMPFDPYEPHVLYKYANPGVIYTETGQRFWLGADQLGRDIMTRLVYGARISLFVSLVSVGIGVTLGALDRYYQRLLWGQEWTCWCSAWSTP